MASQNMSFLDHLEVLRWHIIRIIIAVSISGLVAFLFKEFIFDTIIFGPKQINFPTYRLLCKVANFFGVDSEFCGGELPFTIQSRTMSGQFSAHLWTSIWAGFVVAFPYVIFEIWRFISPGLHPNERRHARGFIFGASLLFFLGVLFGYYIVCPLSINFLGTYQVSSQVLNEFDLSSYIALVRSSCLACGFIFELPIVIYFLTKIGLVTPDFLKKYRKYALIIVLIIAAVITPPDVTSQIIVTIPVMILYQFSIFLSRITYKRNKRKNE